MDIIEIHLSKAPCFPNQGCGASGTMRIRQEFCAGIDAILSLHKNTSHTFIHTLWQLSVFKLNCDN